MCQLLSPHLQHPVEEGGGGGQAYGWRGGGILPKPHFAVA